jgi:hypothetical protein
MAFIISSMLGLAFVSGWILSEVRHLLRPESDRQEQEIKARVEARVAAVQSHGTNKRVLQVRRKYEENSLRWCTADARGHRRGKACEGIARKWVAKAIAER